MALSDRNQNGLPRGERRARQRAPVGVKGKIFFPERKWEEECVVSDLSPDGAGLKSSCSAAVGALAVLYIDGIGRFEGKIVRHDRLRLGVKFDFSEVKRERLAQMITDYVERGEIRSTSVRTRSRLTGSHILHQFILPSGQSRDCEIVDIALSGASLRTDVRPPVGETIMFGKTTAVVVRHTKFGIAVSFQDNSELASASEA
jgi:PilZ domain-containing protein